MERRSAVCLCYVIPVHNESNMIAETVKRLVAVLKDFPGSEILLVENGSLDSSRDAAFALDGVHSGVSVRAFSESGKGLGYAFDRGLRAAFSGQPVSDSQWIVFTGADLPFGFTDFQAFLDVHSSGKIEPILVGSKAHCQSKIETGGLRKLLSFFFRLLRYILLGMRTGDSQGTMFIQRTLVSMLVDRIQSRNYFYTTELICLAERDRVRPIELPVHYFQSQMKRKSNIRPVRDSWIMFCQLIQLRKRLRSN